jgi:nifR3 family TIM-barrel protein
MKIGSVTLDNHTILAPLAGITNLPFRLLAKECGCALVCSEMISSHGLAYQSKKTMDLIDSANEEKPLSVQIFGSKPDIMAEAATIVASKGADIIDINFGCSVKKVVKTGSGVALMKDAKHAEKIIKAVKRAVNIPLTIKIRSGWNPSGDQAVEISKIAEACGADAIAVHPRTATQGFKGHANWSIISRIKTMVSIPVIGNGDIHTAEDAMNMCAQTGCDAVMIGRAAIGNPLIFNDILSSTNERSDPDKRMQQHFNLMIRYVKSSVRYFGEKRACYMMRSRLGWFIKGLNNSNNFRRLLRQISSEKQAIELIQLYMKHLDQ